MKTVDLNGKPFHFIGIGGIGMSALAYVVAKRQIPVSGSDLRTSDITARLKALGVRIFNCQEAANLNWFTRTATSDAEPKSSVLTTSQAEPQSITIAPISSSLNINETIKVLPQIIRSTAINQSNAEYQAALELDCPIFHRSDLLAALIAKYHSIAVSGTHGKTTTSSLIAYMLWKAGLDPTAIIGGEVSAWAGNARVGKSQYLVAEADESDGSLVKHSPAIGIVTNIELDHPDRYQNITEVIEIFQAFANQCQTLIGCLDDEIVRQHLSLDISYGLNAELSPDYTAKNIKYQAQGTEAEIWEKGKCLGVLQLQLLGKHNLSNALSAVAIGRNLGLEFSVIKEAIAPFGGTKRRFEHRGEANGITFIDDYAHHPSEITATLTAARQKVSSEATQQRVVAIFQPHRYSRTETFMNEFANAFKDADVVVLTDIYSAGEKNVSGIRGENLAAAMAANHPQVHYHESLQSLSDFLNQQILRSGDLALFLGAGNLNQIIPQIITLYN